MLVLAALCIVPLIAAAQAPGTTALDLVIHTGVTDLKPGPLTVPNPEAPNLLYDASQKAAPVLAPTPVQLVDAPDGFYVQAADAAPVQLVGWAPGIGQQSIQPLEYATQAFDPEATGLPKLPFLGLDGSAQTAPPALSPAGTLTLPLDLPTPNVADVGVRPLVKPLAEEAARVPGVSEAGAAAPESYRAPLFHGTDAPLREDSAAIVPASLSSEHALEAVLVAGAALLLAKVLLPLYHRFKRKTALDNPTRQRVYELLRAAPGASAAELSQASGLHVTTVKYHLDVLRRVSMVGEQSIDGCRRFFSYENGDRLEFLTRALLDEPAAKAIYEQISTHPGLPFIEVARALGMRKEHVHYHVKKLAKHGLISDKWEAGRRLLFPAVPEGHAGSPAGGPSALHALAAPAGPAAQPPPTLASEVRA